MNVRKFAFVILDEEDNITDRYSLDLVDKLSGLGFQLDISTISTDIEDYVSKIIQKKTNLGMNIYHKSYSAYDSFTAFIQKHMNDNLALEYDDTNNIYYMMGKVATSSKTEKNIYNYLENTISFQPLTPFFRIIKNDDEIQYSDIGKSYPFNYPYSYGLTLNSNNSINNTYIKNIPLIITLYGSFTSSPIVQLYDSDHTLYQEVIFSDVTLEAGQKIIINGATKKIWYDDGSGDLIDYYYKIDPSGDSFLRAKALDTSTIEVNLISSDSGSLKGERRQYKI